MSEKKLVFAGRTQSGTFGIALFNVETIEELSDIMKSDPAVMNAIFKYETDGFNVALLDNDAINRYATT